MTNVYSSEIRVVRSGTADRPLSAAQEARDTPEAVTSLLLIIVVDINLIIITAVLLAVAAGV